MRPFAHLYRVAASMVCLALTACASVPTASPSASPFTVLGPLTLAQQARIIQARTTGLRTLAALVAMSVSTEAQQRTVEMIVNYDAAGKMRFTASKDLFISTRPIFDLLVVDERYSLTLYDDTGTHTHQGAVADFVRDYPTFRAFFLLGEAFFLPGFDGMGQAPVWQGARRCQTRLRSGAKAEWFIKPETLEITKARVTWRHGPISASFLLRYDDYRQVATYYIPERLTLRDRQLNVTTQARLQQIDINQPLAPEIFDFPPAPRGQSRMRETPQGLRYTNGTSIAAAPSP